MSIVKTGIFLEFISFVIVLLTSIAITVNECQASVPDAVLNQTDAFVTIYVSEQDGGNTVTGSGFIIDSDGIVVTNYELISPWLNNNGNSLLIRTYTKGYYVVERVLAADKESDLAVLKIVASDLPVTSLVSGYQPKIGDRVIVIGRPFGAETAVAEGSIKNILGKKNLMEITADVLPGISGSPVFNAKGQVIGVATILLISGESLNFAVPVSLIEGLSKDSFKPGAPGGSAEGNKPNAVKSGPIQPQTNTSKINRSIPSEWLFFSMSENKDAALFYNPKSLLNSGNNIDLAIKWIYLNRQGPSYSNSQKILKLSLGAYNDKLSYGIGSFTFDCMSRRGTETKEIYFDSNDNILLTYVPSQQASAYFAPETVYGYLIDIICKKN